MIPVKWSITYQPLLRTAQVIGSCDENCCEDIMLDQAVSWLETAITDFSAVPLYESPDYKVTSKYMISFKVVFQTEKKFNEFMTYVSNS